jgi:hypothetical protein
VTYSHDVGHGTRPFAASLAAIALALAAPAPTLATAPTGPGVYDPSSPAGDQYSDPFERGRSADGGDRSAAGGGPGAAVPAAGAEAAPTRQADTVAPFGSGVTRRVASGGSDSGSAAPSRADARRAHADRVLAAQEIAGVDSSATGDVILIAAISAALVLGAALLPRVRRRSDH